MRLTRFALSGFLGTLATGLCFVGLTPSARGGASHLEPRMARACPCPPIARLALAAAEGSETSAAVTTTEAMKNAARVSNASSSGECTARHGGDGWGAYGGGYDGWHSAGVDECHQDYGYDPAHEPDVLAPPPAAPVLGYSEPMDAPELPVLLADKPSEVEVLETWYGPRKPSKLTLTPPMLAPYDGSYGHEVDETPGAWTFPDCFTDCRESDLPEAVADEQHSMGQADVMRINAENDGMTVEAAERAESAGSWDEWDADACDDRTLPGPSAANDREPCELNDSDYGDPSCMPRHVDTQMYVPAARAAIFGCPLYGCPLYQPWADETIEASLEARRFDEEGYDRDGYDFEGIDREGYDREGYDSDGYDREGFDREGYDAMGYDSEGLNRCGFDAQGYDANGYDCEGYDRRGYDARGYDRSGYSLEGTGAPDFSCGDYPCGEHQPRHLSWRESRDVLEAAVREPLSADDVEDSTAEPSRIVTATMEVCGRVGRAIAEANMALTGATEAGAVWLNPADETAVAPELTVPSRVYGPVAEEAVEADKRQTYSPADLDGPAYKWPSFTVPSVYELGL